VRLAAASGDNVLPARIETLVYQGAQTEVAARLDDGQRLLLVVTEPAAVPLAVGQTVHAHIPAEALMLLR
jgi:ABC-type molybdate transport system ATPase subunit